MSILTPCVVFQSVKPVTVQIDVTHRFNQLREASRHLRNTCCESGNWEAEDFFGQIDRLLLEVLVLYPLLREHPTLPQDLIQRRDLDRYFRIQPSSEYGIPVMIARDSSTHCGYWDHPIITLKPTEAEISFLEIFDWDQVGFREMKFFMGRIDASAYPEIIGHRVLIECIYSKIFALVEKPLPALTPIPAAPQTPSP